MVRDRAQAVLAFDPESNDALDLLAAAERGLGIVDTSPSILATPPKSSSALADPTSFAGGRHQVKELLGEGGKKRVYLAHDTLLDREVAFALIKTEGLDEAGRTRITREAQAMGRLGSHPHIVTVFDLGTHESQPYMVTELMGGGDGGRGWWRRPPTTSCPWSGPWRSPDTPAAAWSSPTAAESCTVTSSQAMSGSLPMALPRSATSAWRWRWTAPG